MKRNLLCVMSCMLRFVFRHALLITAGLCCMLAADRMTEERAQLTLYERVLEQMQHGVDLPGETVMLGDGLSMYLPSGWMDISASSPDAAHPAWVAAYQGKDVIGRTITLVITRWKDTGVWRNQYHEEDALYFTRWFAGKGRTNYRFFVSAPNAFSAASPSLCRELGCMLRSIRTAE